MKLGRLILLIMLVAWFQAYILGNLVAPPQLLIVLLLAVSFCGNLPAALALAVWGGFWLDVASSLPFGAYMIWFGLLALALMALKRFGLEFESKFSLSLVLGLAVLTYNLWLLAWGWLAIGSVFLPATLLWRWGLQIILTVLAGWLLMPTLRRWLKLWGIDGAQIF